MDARDNEITTEADVCENGEKKKRIGLITRIRRGGFFNRRMKAMFIVFFVSAVIYTVSRLWPDFAEFWTRYPGQGVRFLTAKITGWIPFSFAEATLISLPLIAVGYIIASSVSTRRDDSKKNFNRWLRPLVCVILVIAITFFVGFGPAYGRYTLDKELGLDRKPVSGQQLYDTAVAVASEISPLIEKIDFDINGASVMPYDYDELVKKVNSAFKEYAGNAGYISHFSSYPKPIALSEPMTYTHIAGVYTFMTGESNVNTNYPDFLTPFTMAHEMSHQRGIAREDEANFVAFLVCKTSDDDYIRYCAYANMLNYLMSALSSADRDLHSQFRKEYMPDEVQGEFVAYSKFFDAYRESTASKVSTTVNDAFLHSQGQKAGTKSYGLVVDLAVAYYGK